MIRCSKWFSRKRAGKANSLVPVALRGGRVLDIGCGFFPYLLTETTFSEKYGLDKGINEELKKQLNEGHNLALIDVDLERAPSIPFQSDFFEVVTMLAVLEHFEPAKVLRIVREVERILKPGGVFILTTPAKWAKGLLEYLARIDMVSRIEIAEHKAAYSRKQILAMLEQSGFARPSIRAGYFELFMNIWVKATKEPNLFQLEELEPLGVEKQRRGIFARYMNRHRKKRRI